MYTYIIYIRYTVKMKNIHASLGEVLSLLKWMRQNNTVLLKDLCFRTDNSFPWYSDSIVSFIDVPNVLEMQLSKHIVFLAACSRHLRKCSYICILLYHTFSLINAKR